MYLWGQYPVSGRFVFLYAYAILKDMKNVLAVIPARAGSKRIPDKNIKNFLGKPLIAYTIEHALKNKNINRVIVDTDSEKIAAIAKKYGAEVPFLRPRRLATDSAKIADAILVLLERLRHAENYAPEYVVMMQITSPLRLQEDINACFDLIKKGSATTVVTMCETQPILFNRDKSGYAHIANKFTANSTNAQAWPTGLMGNGNVYVVKTKFLIKEKAIYTKKTKVAVCPRWRSVDIDIPEDWVLAETLYPRLRKISDKIKNFRN